MKDIPPTTSQEQIAQHDAERSQKLQDLMDSVKEALLQSVGQFVGPDQPQSTSNRLDQLARQINHESVERDIARRAEVRERHEAAKRAVQAQLQDQFGGDHARVMDHDDQLNEMKNVVPTDATDDKWNPPANPDGGTQQQEGVVVPVPDAFPCVLVAQDADTVEWIQINTQYQGLFNIDGSTLQADYGDRAHS